eukprot:9484931-Pyramimonas_sp.AAC.1
MQYLYILRDLHFDVGVGFDPLGYRNGALRPKLIPTVEWVHKGVDPPVFRKSTMSRQPARITANRVELFSIAVIFDMSKRCQPGSRGVPK